MSGHKSITTAEAGIQFRIRVFKWIPAFTGMTIIVFLLITFHLSLITPTFAQISLDVINQKVCDRFEEDTARLAAIMEEVRDRKGIKETRVAYGQVDTPIKQADYWVTFAAEAIAFQRAQKYSSEAQLKSSLEILRNKVLRAKNEVGKVIN